MFSIEWLPEWLLPVVIIIPIVIILIFVFHDLDELSGLLVGGASIVAVIIITAVAFNSPVKIASDTPVTIQNYYAEPKTFKEIHIDRDKILGLLKEETELDNIDYLENDETTDAMFNGSAVDFHGISSEDKYIEGKFYFTEDSLEIIIFSETEQEQVSLPL